MKQGQPQTAPSRRRSIRPSAGAPRTPRAPGVPAHTNPAFFSTLRQCTECPPRGAEITTHGALWVPSGVFSRR